MEENNSIKMNFKEKKNYWTLSIFCPLIIFLTYFEYLIITGNLTNSFINLIIFFIAGIYLVFVFRTLLWNLFGREEIEITNEKLIIVKKGTFFVTQKVYELQIIENIKIENNNFSFWEFFVSKTALLSLKSYGSVFFEYKNCINNFGGNITYNKAKWVVEILNQRKLIGRG